MSNPAAAFRSFLQRVALGIRRSPIGWLAALVVGEVLLAQRQLYGPLGFDESYFLFEGWAVRQGLVPYRDFIEFKPPVVFWLNALAERLFGVEGWRYRWLFVLLLVVATVLLFLVLCRRGALRPAAFLAVAATAYALLAPHLHDASLDDAETIGIEVFIFAQAALLWNGPRRALTTAIGGALLALTVLSKEPYAPAVLAAWVTLGFVARDDRLLGWSRYAKLTILGAAAVTAPVLFYLAVTRAIPFYVHQMRIYFAYASQIGCLHPRGLRELIAQAWPRLTEKILIRDMFASGVPLFIAFAVLPGWGFGARLGLVATVLGGLYAVTVGGCYFPHYFVMGMAGLFLWLALGALVLSRHVAVASPEVRRWTGWVLMGALMVHMGPTVALAQQLHPARSRNTIASVPAAVITYVRQHTAPRDYVLTDGGPDFYVLSGRLPAIREICLLDELIDMKAGRTDEERLAAVRDELRAHRPKIVFLAPDFAPRKGRVRRALLEPYLRAEHYQQVMTDLYLRP